MSIIVGIVIETLSIFGLCLTLLFLVSLVRWGYLKEDVPFTVIFNLALSYFCHLCIITFHSAPEVILGHDPFSEELEHAAKYAYVCFWYVTLYCQNLMVVNRYIAVCQFHKYKTTLSLFRVRMFCIVAWIIGFLVAAIPEAGVCCRLVFDTHLVKSAPPNVTFDSSSEEVEEHSAEGHTEQEETGSSEVHGDSTELTGYRTQTNWVLAGTHILNFLTIFTMVILYVKILVRVKQTQQNAGREKTKKDSRISRVEEENGNKAIQIDRVENDADRSRLSSRFSAAVSKKSADTRSENQIRRMSFQIFLLSFVFTVFCLFQFLVQFVFTNVVMMLILQFAYLLNCSVIPVVFLILNEKLRKQILATLLLRHKNSVTQNTVAPGVTGKRKTVARAWKENPLLSL